MIKLLFAVNLLLSTSLLTINKGILTKKLTLIIVLSLFIQSTASSQSGLPNGFYFIKVGNDRAKMVGKMVKK